MMLSRPLDSNLRMTETNRTGGGNAQTPKTPKAPRRRGLLKKVGGCNRRSTKYVRDIEMNFALMNCRSLKFKLDSMETSILLNKSCFTVATETWFKRLDKQLKEKLNNLEDRSNIVCIRKDRKIGKKGTAHGGVALFLSLIHI